MRTKREKTILIVTGIVVGLLLLDQVLITPLWDAYTLARTRIDNAQRELREAQALARNSLRARRVWKDMAANTVKADAPEAESQLLNGVRVWAQQAGVNLTSLQPERTEDAGSFDRLIVRASATGDMNALSRFLYAAETSQVPVRVADLTLASRQDGEDDLSLQVGFATIYRPPVAEQEEAR